MFAVVAVVNIQSLILKKHEEFLPFKLFIMKNTEFIYFFYCVLPQSHTIWENFFYLYYYFFMDFLCYIKIPNDHTETGKTLLGFHGNAMDEYFKAMEF